VKSFLSGGKRPRRPARILNASILRSSFERRAVLIGTVQGGIGVLLAARMGYLAIAENEKYRLESESNRVNLTLIPPRRGWILDRNGAPLASNRADFRVDIIPERLADPEGTIDQLGELLGLAATRIADIKDKVAQSRGFQPVEVASGLEYEQFAALSVRLPDLPENHPAFLAAYAVAAAGSPKITAAQAQPGTLGALALSYLASPEFRGLAENACKVTLHLEFTASSLLVGAAAGRLFDRVTNNLVDAVGRRARQLYG
jgi:hypothetical protein